MKPLKSFALFAVATLLSLTLRAADVTLAWSPSPGSTFEITTTNVVDGFTNTVTYPAQVLGYAVYGSATLSNFTRIAGVSATTLTCTITNLPAAMYFFEVKATNAWTESDPSNIIASPAAIPPQVSGLKILKLVK
jgi:hypothetical protein